MANVVKMEINSAEIRRLQKKLLQLEPRLQQKAIKGATTKAMRPVTNEAKRQARKTKRTGWLAKNITQVTRSYKRGVTMTIAGAANKKDPRTGENPANIAHLIEFPVKPHEIRRKAGAFSNVEAMKKGVTDTAFFSRRESVDHPGFEGRPFLNPAFDSKSREAEKIYAGELEKALIKEALRP